MSYDAADFAREENQIMGKYEKDPPAVDSDIKRLTAFNTLIPREPLNIIKGRILRITRKGMRKNGKNMKRNKAMLQYLPAFTID